MFRTFWMLLCCFVVRIQKPVYLLYAICGKNNVETLVQQRRTATSNLFTPVCNDSVTQFELCQAPRSPQWINIACNALYCRIRWQCYFQPSRKQKESYLLRMVDKGTLSIPDLSRTWLLAEANSSFLLRCLWGQLAQRRWNRNANMPHCLHLALSPAAKFPGQR